MRKTPVITVPKKPLPHKGTKIKSLIIRLKASGINIPEREWSKIKEALVQLKNKGQL